MLFLIESLKRSEFISLPFSYIGHDRFIWVATHLYKQIESKNKKKYVYSKTLITGTDRRVGDGGRGAVGAQDLVVVMSCSSYRWLKSIENDHSVGIQV